MLCSVFLDFQWIFLVVLLDIKLLKLDVFVLVIIYIVYLMRILNEGVDDNQLFVVNGIMYLVKVWELSSYFFEDFVYICFVWLNLNEKVYCFWVKKINIYCVYYLNLKVWLYYYIFKL